MKPIDALWDTLRRIRTCEFRSHSSSLVATGWSGSGSGVVSVESPAPTVLLFRESGTWHPTPDRPLRFHNLYRWTRLDDDAESVRLEHLRFGAEHPVYLFDLAPDSDGTWSSVTPHMCRDDAYAARLSAESDTLMLSWTVIGPKKNEAIAYTYSS